MNDKQIKTLLQELWEKGNKPKFDLRPVSKQTIIDICQFAAEKFLKEPPFLEFDPPVKICGDIHGQFRDLLRIFSFANQPSTTQKYLFLGDYVDRGPQSIETILYLFLQKIRYPKTVLLLRGNHEIPNVKTVLFTTTYSFEFGLSRAIKRQAKVSNSKSMSSNFLSQIMERYNDNFIWQVFQDVFNCMPVAALISRKIFCAHGGISPDLKHFDQLRRLIRPTIIPERGEMSEFQKACLLSDYSMSTVDFCTNSNFILKL
uniref:Serine/threonine-protein phosphatase n=1 Tax=Romanomermis culicivorax TaxID=13658 RepID=A0A915KGE4_ROMCU